MSINEMIKNIKALNIPGLNVNLTMTVDELNETVRNAMFERFISTVAAYGEVCGISAIRDPREFAVDVIKNDNYVKNCLTATINLVLNGGFYNRMALNGFLNRILWSPVVKACQEEFNNNVTVYEEEWTTSEDE